MTNLFLKNIKEYQELLKKLPALSPSIEQAIKFCTQSLRNDKKIIFCGNGGSAADSQHLAAEFVGRFIKDRMALAAISLATDTSILTSVGNDYTFRDIFSRQVLGLGQKGDCIVGISTSGNSENIVSAINVANEKGMHTIGLLGRNGGVLAKMCDCSIIVPSNVTARIQEAHILIGHTICGEVEFMLGMD